jgi:hypothetical protein
MSVMILREEGDGWQLFAVLLILAVLGEILAPILDRYAQARDKEELEERLLGTVAGASIVAVRGRGGVVRVGDDEITLRNGESVVVRPSG